MCYRPDLAALSHLPLPPLSQFIIKPTDDCVVGKEDKEYMILSMIINDNIINTKVLLV
jgi:hypothetical protein